MWWLLDETTCDGPKMSIVLNDVEFWGIGELDASGHPEEVCLREAYIILDFMPDPPKLPEIGSND